MKKIIAFLLALTALLLVVPTFGCSGGGGTDTAPEAVTTPEEGEGKKTDAEVLGFGSENYDTKFVILQNNVSDLASDIFAEETNGNMLNDATYNRLLACEEYLGIKIEFKLEPGQWNSKMPDMIYNDVATSPTASFDMVNMGLNTGIMGGLVGAYRNIREMESIDLSHEWWVEQIAEDASVAGKLICLVGDINKSTYGYMGCVFANIELTDRFNLGVDYYKLVKERSWTLDKFLELSKKVVDDGDGDYTISYDKDTFGWANVGISSRVMWSCADVNLISKDADGKYNWVSSLDDRTVSFVEKLYEASQLNNVFYFASILGDNGAVKPFSENRCLFLSFLVYTAQKLTEMQSQFAILPMPLYDFNQTDYISANMSAFDAIFFPANIASDELSGKVAEFLGWYGRETIVPAYYDVSLKYQYSNVNDNVEMLDLIRDRLRMTSNELFGTVGNGIGLTAMTAANTSVQGFYAQPVSVWKEKVKQLRKTLEDYMAEYED